MRTTVEQAKDTGLAAVLILLLVSYLGEVRNAIPAAIVTLVVAMTVPVIFRPAARLWFGLSHLIGTVASKVILSLVFFLVATPMGILRRLLGADSMRRRAWKSGEGSAFVVRDHVFARADLDRPY